MLPSMTQWNANPNVDLLRRLKNVLERVQRVELITKLLRFQKLISFELKVRRLQQGDHDVG